MLSCLVRAWLPHDLHGGRPLIRARDDSVPPALGHAQGEWHRLARYDADGPDGNLRGYQQEQVRCAAAEGWDAGDDSEAADTAA